MWYVHNFWGDSGVGERVLRTMIIERLTQLSIDLDILSESDRRNESVAAFQIRAYLNEPEMFIRIVHNWLNSVQLHSFRRKDNGYNHIRIRHILTGWVSISLLLILFNRFDRKILTELLWIFEVWYWDQMIGRETMILEAVIKYLRFSQRLPRNPGWHLQTKLARRGWQIPPFWHGVKVSLVTADEDVMIIDWCVIGICPHGGPLYTATFCCSLSLSINFSKTSPLMITRCTAPCKFVILGTSRDSTSVGLFPPQTLRMNETH